MSDGGRYNVANKAKQMYTYMSYYKALMLLSTLFSSVAAIVALYGERKDGTCRYGFVLAPVVLQAIAVTLSLTSFLFTCGDFSNQVTQNFKKAGKWNWNGLLPERPNLFEILGGILQLLANITSLVLLVLIVVQENGCNNKVLSNTNSIFGILLPLAATAVTSLSEQPVPRFVIKSIDAKNHIYKIKRVSEHKRIRFLKPDRFQVYVSSQVPSQSDRPPRQRQSIVSNRRFPHPNQSNMRRLHFP